MITQVIVRATALLLGSAAAGVGCYAAYEAAAQANGGYLMVAAPVVALSGALLPAYADYAVKHRQYLRALVLILVWLPAAAVVFFNAAERVHSAKALGEAQREANRTVVTRAGADLTEAKTEAKAATAAADKVRGKTDKTCHVQCASLKASEAAALDRVAKAQAALAAAEAHAVTEADLKAPDWLLPAALDIVGMVLIGCGFGLGAVQGKPTAAREEVPAKEAPAMPKAPRDRSAAAKKAWATRRKRTALKAATVTGKRKLAAVA